MDQLTHNLERLRRSVDTRVQQLLIKRKVAATFPLPDSVSTQSALPPQPGIEPSITPLGANARQTRGVVQRLGSATSSDTTPPKTLRQVPAVSEQSFFRRVLSWLGF